VLDEDSDDEEVPDLEIQVGGFKGVWVGLGGEGDADLTQVSGGEGLGGMGRCQTWRYRWGSV
jgi:hypothetical protein